MRVKSMPLAAGYVAQGRLSFAFSPTQAPSWLVDTLARIGGFQSPVGG